METLVREFVKKEGLQRRSVKDGAVKQVQFKAMGSRALYVMLYFRNQGNLEKENDCSRRTAYAGNQTARVRGGGGREER